MMLVVDSDWNVFVIPKQTIFRQFGKATVTTRFEWWALLENDRGPSAESFKGNKCVLKASDGGVLFATRVELHYVTVESVTRSQFLFLFDGGAQAELHSKLRVRLGPSCPRLSQAASQLRPSPSSILNARRVSFTELSTTNREFLLDLLPSVRPFVPRNIAAPVAAYESRVLSFKENVGRGVKIHKQRFGKPVRLQQSESAFRLFDLPLDIVERVAELAFLDVLKSGDMEEWATLMRASRSFAEVVHVSAERARMRGCEMLQRFVEDAVGPSTLSASIYRDFGVPPHYLLQSTDVVDLLKAKKGSLISHTTIVSRAASLQNAARCLSPMPQNLVVSCQK